jgi:hypothetical protein
VTALSAGATKAEVEVEAKKSAIVDVNEFESLKDEKNVYRMMLNPLSHSAFLYTFPSNRDESSTHSPTQPSDKPVRAHPTHAMQRQVYWPITIAHLGAGTALIPLDLDPERPEMEFNHTPLGKRCSLGSGACVWPTYVDASRDKMRASKMCFFTSFVVCREILHVVVSPAVEGAINVSCR